METTEFTYSKLTDMSVEMQSQTKRDMTLLHGKAVLNESEKRFTFLQNPPRGKRSTEVGRTMHGRMVRRNDGLYTLTFRMIDMNEKYISESLISEVRNIVKIAKNDQEAQKLKEAEEFKKAQEAIEAEVTKKPKKSTKSKKTSK